MKQLIQYFRDGKLELIDSPIPKSSSVDLVIESSKSLISVGTEKMLLNFGKASYLNKAKQQPDKVKQVLDKVKTEGLISTVEAVWSKLNEPIPLGYSNIGKIVQVGDHVNQFRLDERVISNGNHAEYVRVPWTLTAKVPEPVSDEEAAFTVPGAICLEGIRLLKPTLGETIVVVGLGLLGQLVSQILQANGCKVISFDIDQKKVDLAKNIGVEAVLSGTNEDNINYVLGKTNGVGADGVVITASTASEEMLSQCALMSRKRGRIVLIGVIPIQAPRNLFYEKELTFQVSAAYGPGRYDMQYEEKGNDYPLPFVRWTAKRNMDAFLFLLEHKKIDVNKLITHRFEFNQIIDAYNTIKTDDPLGIIINYTHKENISVSNEIDVNYINEIRVGFIGAGNFAKMVLLPVLKKEGAIVNTIVDTGGFNASVVAKRFSIGNAEADKDVIFNDKNINTVFIATRHNTHADLVVESINNNKHVFVEKPLAMNMAELKRIELALSEHNDVIMMVGFNRRFSPFTEILKNRLDKRSNPISIIMTVNAGSIPIDHWVHDLEIGGGRIIGEACHFIDLARFITGHPIVSIGAMSTVGHSESDNDKVTMIINFKDGSLASINYLANGNKKYPKESIEVFSSEKIYKIDNFRKLESFGDTLKYKTKRQDKGHSEEIKAFKANIESGKASPISHEELFEIHLATFAVNISLQYKKIVLMEDMWADFRIIEM